MIYAINRRYSQPGFEYVQDYNEVTMSTGLLQEIKLLAWNWNIMYQLHIYLFEWVT